MSETKHTPGPWEIEPKERWDHPLYVMSGDGDRLAKCDGLNMADFGPNPEQCKANARLVAAAPDLYAACELALQMTGHNHWDETQQRGAGCPICIRQQEIVGKIRAALNLATEGRP